MSAVSIAPDAGRTWQQVLKIDADTGVVDVALDRDGRTFFAAAYQRRRRGWGFIGGGTGGGLYRSLDGGDTWQKLELGLPKGVVGRIGVEISRSNSNRGTPSPAQRGVALDPRIAARPGRNRARRTSG